MNNKVLLGMSGGIDSSVSAILLKEQGYEVIGATMLLCSNENSKSIEDAKNVCQKLNIPHYVIDCRETFQKKVIANFINTYKDGKTPNPCIECNQYLKFGEFYKKAIELGCEHIATGHYAKIEYSEEYKQYILKIADEKKKDQSYFLYRIPKEILSKIIFPLSQYSSKEEIRNIARENNLEIAEKKESQEICFIHDNNYSKFVIENSHIKYKKGKFVNSKGESLGTHNGIVNYTVGQRKGLGVSYKEPLYVLKIDKNKNEVILGTEKELYAKEVIIEDLNYLITDLEDREIEVKAKVRYRAQAEHAIIKPMKNGSSKVIFDKPQRAITPGQSLVFYKDDILIGGGKIIK